MPFQELAESVKQAFASNDAQQLRSALERHPELRSQLNEPWAAFDSPPITQVRSREMLDVLLEAGADINAKSRWWAGGFGLLHQADPELAAYAIERGAKVDIHAAARLGLLREVRELVETEPSLIHARGGDGQTPLHFASTIGVAECLLEHGAEIDARDVDHESTPAQYMIDERQAIARWLVSRGCRTDVLMAAALGDIGLVRHHLEEDPGCIRMRVTHEYFPMIGRKAGGTIYQWTLGWFVSPHEVALKFGHPDVAKLLMDRSPPDVALMVHCWAGDGEAVKLLLAQHPEVVSALAPTYRPHPAYAARNNNLAAVQTMLAAGLPVDSVGQHGATPLHWAAFHGNAEMAAEILRYKPPLEVKDGDFQATPVGWAIHGSENGWHRGTGDYAGTVETLLKAGAKPPAEVKGPQPVRAVFRRMGIGE